MNQHKVKETFLVLLLDEKNVLKSYIVFRFVATLK